MCDDAKSYHHMYEINDVANGSPRDIMETPSETEGETELQIEEAVTRLSSITEIQPRAWEQLDMESKLIALQTVENNMAEIQGRPPLPVNLAEMAGNTFGQFDGSQIQINHDHLAENAVEVSEFVDTIVHEGRHGYQYYSIDHPGYHPNADQVQSWEENLRPGNYLTVEQFGQELYQNQPVEADAWHYASSITAAIYEHQQGINK